jgi:hypothetical protein
MVTVHRINTGRVNADFFTSSYRFSANVMVYKRRLVDVLGDPITDYLELVDVYISRINNPGDIVATYAKGSLIKQEISFLLLPNEEEGKSKQRFYGSRENLPVFISVPSFELVGEIQWGRQELEIKKIMASDTHKFLSVLNATATNSAQPKVSFQGPLALVNKSKIQIVCTGNRG